MSKNNYWKCCYDIKTEDTSYHILNIHSSVLFMKEGDLWTNVKFELGPVLEMEI
jgi:hypothetical protein